MTSNKILLVGGGSGGHISMLKAAIDELKKRQFDVENNLLLVGGKLGMINDPGNSLEAKRFPEFGVPFVLIRGGKLHRALKWKSITLLSGVILGFKDAFLVLRKFKPDIVFSTGGYVALPVVILARALGSRVIIHEQTMTAGLSNRISGYFAHRIFLGFESARKYFAASKVEVVGNVLRTEVFSNSPPTNLPSLVAFVERAKKENAKIIYITGGSLGAHKINIFVKENLVKLANEYFLIWQTGENHLYNDFAIGRKIVEEKSLSERVFVTDFLREELGYVYANSDIIFSRPGINTVYELAVLGKRAILFPLWVSAKGDQEANAVWYSQNFAGEIIREKDLIFSVFKKKVEGLLSCPPKGSLHYQTNVLDRILDEMVN